VKYVLPFVHREGLGQHVWQLYSVVGTFIHIDKYTKCEGMSIQ